MKWVGRKEAKDNKVKDKISKLPVLCYIVSVILLIVAVYTTITNVLYLKSYAETYGTSLATMWQDVVSYIISGFIPYFAYGFISFVLGKICNKLFEDFPQLLYNTVGNSMATRNQ